MVTTQKQWHWILEICPTCKTQGQKPVQDDIGEDCNLFEELGRMKRQEYICVCGTRYIYKYNHAQADQQD